MTHKPGRFPEGEPKVESVLAALAMAREDAMRRKAAVEARLKEAQEQSGDGEPTAAERVPAEDAP